MINSGMIKKALTISAMVLALQNYAFSQTVEDLFSRTGEKVVWLGLDFTQVRLTGELGTVGKNELIPLFDDMNRIIVSESDKYNFKAALRKDEIPYDLEMVAKLNSALDPGQAIGYSSSDREGRLNEEAISVLVKQYKIKKPEGIGLVFFVETMDKEKEKATMWVTFFSLSDRNVLLTEKMSGVAGGITFKNHWVRPVFEVVEKIRDYKYQEWRNRYIR